MSFAEELQVDDVKVSDVEADGCQMRADVDVL